MIATISFKSNEYKIDFSKPIDISIPIDVTKRNINAWYIDDPKIIPEEFDDKKMTVRDGASVNFNGIYFNPHSHVTHTECVGHITEEVYSVHENLKEYFVLAQLISVTPKLVNKDFIITKKQVEKIFVNNGCEAIIIRTLPNAPDKKSKRYSNTNPPYLEESAANFFRKKGVKHLLIDLPSVDKERDNGALLAHKAFWNVNEEEEIRLNATITEFVYVDNSVIDGCYFLNLMIAPFENDATPSCPILYEIIK